MANTKIVYIRGLWSHPKAVDWIVNKIHKETNLPVELFDFHDEFSSTSDNQTYIKAIIEKYGNIYKDDDNIILYGHSHGGALAIILNAKFGSKKLILSNMCLEPFGIVRKISNNIKAFLGSKKIGKGYKPHYELKYDGEIEERLQYFKSNFNLKHNLSRLIFIGKEAKKLVNTINVDTLYLQSLSDELASVKPNIRFYKKINLPEYLEGTNLKKEPATKQMIKVPNGEHAILEEINVYPSLNKLIAEFIKR